ncbi:MAG: glycosyltransferase [Actinobacteria bacterium]|nr:glycosyltransferase [Actinomycetota bacterium]
MPDRSPLRVLHVIDSLRTGGAEALLTALVRALDEDRLAANALLVPSAASANADHLRAMRAHTERMWVLDVARISDPRLLRGLLGAIRAFRPAVVHSHLSTANIHSRAAARLLRVPHVTTVHTMPGPNAEDLRSHVLLDGWSAHLSARIVAPSQEVADAFGRAFRIPGKRLRVIPNAPAAPRPAAGFDPATLRAELLGDRAGPLVVCVARLQREKGIGELAEAAAALRARLPGLVVAVAGAGPEREPLERQAAELGLEGTLRLLGRRGDVGELLAAADAFCLPSWHEGLPLSLLEALDAGLPCVATAVGGVPELLGGDEAGLLVPARDAGALADALARVLTDVELAQRLARAGRALVEREHALGAVARRHAELYAEVARG